MSITVSTRKRLWGRAAARCAYAPCRIELFEDSSLTDDPTLVGEEAHIVAREDEGPRGDAAYPVEKRDLYGNLVLLCCTHHKLVDTDVARFTVDALKELKATHEQWVRDALKLDAAKLSDDERYATIIEEWATRADLANWSGWTSFLMANGQPELREREHARLHDLKRWMFGRIYPRRYAELEAAWECFFRVLNDLLRVFDGYSEAVGDPGDRTLWIQKKYKAVRSLEERDRLAEECEAITYLVEDLTIELTRAGNLVCDQIRRHVSPTFRVAEGLLVLTSGPNFDLSYTTYRPQYPVGRSAADAYPGLAKFKTTRLDDAPHFGRAKDNKHLETIGARFAPDDDDA